MFYNLNKSSGMFYNLNKPSGIEDENDCPIW